MAMVLEFAGQARVFDLRLGELIDVEEACGKVGIGTLFKRFATSDFYASDVRAILTYGLKGGGMSLAEASMLVDAQMRVKPMMELSSLATDVMVKTMTGVEPDELSAPREDNETFDKGALFHGFVQAGISPQQVREMSYSDFVAIMRKAGGKDVQPPSENEFNDMIQRWKDRQAG